LLTIRSTSPDFGAFVVAKGTATMTTEQIQGVSNQRLAKPQQPLDLTRIDECAAPDGTGCKVRFVIQIALKVELSIEDMNSFTPSGGIILKFCAS
jgi:hypothetical protein